MSTRHSPHRATASPGAGCQRGGLPTIPCCPEAVARSPGDHGPRTAVTSGLQLSEPDPEVASDWRPCAALSAACIPYPLTGMQRMPSVCVSWRARPGSPTLAAGRRRSGGSCPPPQPASPWMPGRAAVTLTSETPPCRLSSGPVVDRCSGCWVLRPEPHMECQLAEHLVVGGSGHGSNSWKSTLPSWLHSTCPQGSCGLAFAITPPHLLTIQVNESPRVYWPIEYLTFFLLIWRNELHPLE